MGVIMNMNQSADSDPSRMNTKQEKMFAAFLQKHGHQHVIDAKNLIHELLEKMLIEGWNNASESCCGCLGFLDSKIEE